MTSISATIDTLAIHGGSPVRPTLLPYGRQSLEESDVQAVVEVLRSDWLTTGPKVAQFEEAFAEWVGSKYAVSFSSGTAALHAAAFAAGLGPGDEAITTPLTFCATANCILYQNARPVFADVCEDTLTIDPDQISKRINSRSRAILPVDYAGHPADLELIAQLAQQHGLIVIEDACHALGAEYRGQRVGSIADLTVFSFHPVKHLTTGEGGMVTTDRGHLAHTLRRFRNHGINTDARQRQAAHQWYYEMVLLGFNYRLSDISCALGFCQLQKLEANLARRRDIAKRYAAAFSTIPGLLTPPVRLGVEPSWHLYPIRLQQSSFSASRNQIFRALRAENIGVNVHYIPVHQHPYYRQRFGCNQGEYPIAENAFEQLISLPMFHGMHDQDVEDVIEALFKVLSVYVAK